MAGVDSGATTTALTTLAADIRRAHEAAEQAFATAVEHAIRCGELLSTAKAQLPHGQWLPWLDANFPASRRTAQNYMRLAGNAADAQRVAHLGIKGALGLLASPRDGDPLAESLAELEKRSDDNRAALEDAEQRLAAIDLIEDRAERLNALARLVEDARDGEAVTSAIAAEASAIAAEARALTPTQEPRATRDNDVANARVVRQQAKLVAGIAAKARLVEDLAPHLDLDAIRSLDSDEKEERMAQLVSARTVLTRIIGALRAEKR